MLRSALIVLAVALSAHGSSYTTGGSAASSAPQVLLSSFAGPGRRSLSTGVIDLFSQQTYFQSPVEIGTPPQSFNLQVTPWQTGGNEDPRIQISTQACTNDASFSGGTCTIYETDQSSTFQEINSYGTLDMDNFTFTLVGGATLETEALFVPVPSGGGSACWNMVGGKEACKPTVVGSFPLVGAGASASDVPPSTNLALQISDNLAQAACPNDAPFSASVTGVPGSATSAIATLCAQIPPESMQITTLLAVSVGGQNTFSSYGWGGYSLPENVGVSTALTGSLGIDVNSFSTLLSQISDAVGIDGSNSIRTQQFSSNILATSSYSTQQYCGIDVSSLPSITFSFSGPCNDGGGGTCRGEITLTGASYMLPISSSCYMLYIHTASQVDLLIGLPFFQQQQIYLLAQTPTSATSSYVAIPSGFSVSFVPPSGTSAYLAEDPEGSTKAKAGWSILSSVGKACIIVSGALVLVAASIASVSLLRKRYFKKNPLRLESVSSPKYSGEEMT